LGFAQTHQGSALDPPPFGKGGRKLLFCRIGKDKGEFEMPQTFILAVRPGRIHDAGSRGLPLAHLAYRVGKGPHLFRANGPVTPHGGLMVMDAPCPEEGGEVESFCHEVLRECAARKFTGVVCRFEGARQELLSKICAKLSAVCAGRGLACYVSEAYGQDAPGAGVFIPTALSGGSLQERLGDAKARFGDRVAVWVDRSAEDFLLPSPGGAGAPLTAEELEQRKAEHSAQVFFSDELCAHYFTYMAGKNAHFVLFDDAGSVRKKLHCAEQAGIETVFLPYDAMEDILQKLLP